MHHFEKYARYYNLFYSDKDYPGEAKTVDGIIKKYIQDIPKDRPVKLLNMGCGTGRHDGELQKLGYETKGIDLSEDMIKIALENGGSDVRFETGDIRTFRDGTVYDVCTSLFHVISYQNSNEDLLAAFKTANTELKPGGLFVFDCWYGPGVLSDKPAVRIKKVEDGDSVFIRHAVPVIYPDKDLVDVNYEVLVIEKDGEKETVSSLKETHSMRYLFTPEVKLMLEMSGFELICCMDCNTLDEVTFDSWTAYFVARKIKEI